jgi:hypothetical protein
VFNAPEKAKQRLISTIETLHDKPITELPPILEGESAVKCSYCHARSKCQELARQESIAGSEVELGMNAKQTVINVAGGLL